MNSRKPFNCRVFLFWFFLATLISTLVSSIVVVASPSPTIKVDPPLTSKAPNETFSVNVAVSDITDDQRLVAWMINLTFNPAVIHAVNVEEGPFLKQAGKTMQAGTIIDNSTGCVVAGWSLSSYLEPGASGSGVLATVTFKVVAEGKSPLAFFFGNVEFQETSLRSWNGNVLTIIPFEAVDGAFGYPRDLAVTSVESSSDLVLAGEAVAIDVNVENLGFVDEVFNVTVFYGANEIDTQTDLTLDSLATKSVSFNWDTTGVAQGTYSLKARVTGFSDVNVTNNEFVGDSVTIGLVHSVAITNVTAFPSSVHSGENMSVVVSVFNKGSVTESFDVTLWCGANVIGTQSVSSLVPGGSWSLVFTWDTKDVGAGDYVLTAMTTVISGETETIDNTLTDVVVEVAALSLLVPFEFFIVVVVVAVAEAVIGLAAFVNFRRKGR